MAPNAQMGFTKTLLSPDKGIEPGSLFASRYRIIEELGRGGMGVAFKAMDTRLNRTVALKFLAAELTRDGQAKARFIQEARTASAPDHPNICTIYEIDESGDGQVFLSMAFYGGGNLKTKIEEGPLAPEQATNMALQIARGLSKAHQTGIVHRDIKPANIMLSADGIVKIVDFGIAKLSGAAKLTRTGAMVGTVAYMSPEQASGEEVDQRSDIWSMGVVLYEMLTGRLPFEGDHAQSLIYSITHKEPEALEKLCDRCPENLRKAVEICLQKNPDRRFQTADEFIELVRGDSDAGSIRPEAFSVDVIKSVFQKKKHNLPPQLTSFIGRGKEMHEVEDLLTKNRLVSLTGTGGGGKTRLALQVASDLVESYKEGVWFIDLAPHNEASHVASTTAEVLQIQEEFGVPILDTICKRLKKKHLLLILDNCEHLLEACIGMAEKLLKTCPDLKILTTSREALNIPGERTWRVPSLSTPDPEKLTGVESLAEDYEAVELFLDRATGQRPQFKLTPKNAKTVAAICAHLDGIPLALELAAARIRQLDPQTILARLDDRFRLLKASGSGTFPRQQTLLATVDWSHELLSEDEKILLRRLSVFSGGFVLEAAEEVCSSEPLIKEDVIDLVSALVDKSLVVTDLQEDGTFRYGLLETIRHYSQTKLSDSGEVQRIRDNHFRYFLALAEEADKAHFETTSKWLFQLENEHDNLRAALEWKAESPEDQIALAGALYWFWQAHSHYATAIKYLNEDVLENQKAGPQTARAYYGAGMLYTFFMGRLDDTIKMLDKSYEMWLELGNPREAGTVLMDKGFAGCFSENFQAAMSCFQKCIEIFHEHGDDRLRLRVKLLLAFGHICQFQHKEAEAILTPLFDEAKKYRMTEGISNFHHYYADCAMLRGDFKEGEKRYAVALVESLNLGDLFQTAIEIQGMVICIAGQSRSQKAFRLYGAAMAEFDELGINLPYVKFWQGSITKQLDHARSLIGEGAAKAAEEEGRRMGFEAAVEYALDFDRD